MRMAHALSACQPRLVDICIAVRFDYFDAYVEVLCHHSIWFNASATLCLLPGHRFATVATCCNLQKLAIFRIDSVYCMLTGYVKCCCAFVLASCLAIYTRCIRRELSAAIPSYRSGLAGQCSTLALTMHYPEPFIHTICAVPQAPRAGLFIGSSMSTFPCMPNFFCDLPYRLAPISRSFPPRARPMATFPVPHLSRDAPYPLIRQQHTQQQQTPHASHATLPCVIGL